MLDQQASAADLSALYANQKWSETKQDLRLKDGVRWFTYWKGRLVVMADVTAM